MSVRLCALGLRGGSIVGALPAEDVRISASVGSGGVNRRSDVVIIQSLLNLVPSVSGGPTKPLKVDGIVGPLTIGAIRRFQSVNLGFSDGRIDPGGKTLARLNSRVQQQAVTSPAPSARSSSGGPLLGFAAAAAPAPAAKPTPLAAAIAATPTAKLWTGAAIVHLTTLRQGLIATGGVIFLPTIFDVVNTHFHLDRDASNISGNLTKVIGVFNRIVIMLSDPTTFYREGPETVDSKFADAPEGGFSLPEPQHHITIRPQYPDCGPNCQAAMLVHEGSHFCGGFNEIGHFAHEFPIPDGEPQDGSTHNYAQMTTDESLKNASSYAAFAIHAFFLQDLRFGLDKKTQ